MVLALTLFAASSSFAASADTTFAAQPVSANYSLSVADILKVEVAGDPNATRIARIAADGTFSLPYLNDPAKLSGLTVAEACKAIAKLYVDQQIFVKPQVSITIVQYVEQHINVAGQVNHPGVITIPPGQTMTLVDAIAAVGGVTRIADRLDVTISRKLPDGELKIIPANLKQAMDDARADVPLEDGDNIYVPEAIIAR